MILNNKNLKASNHFKKKIHLLLIFLFLVSYSFILPQQLQSISLKKADSIASSMSTQNGTILDSSMQLSEELKTKKNPYSFLINSSDKKNDTTIRQENEWGLLVLKLIFVLIALIILIYIFILFLKKIQSKKLFNSNLPSELYSILGNAPITFNKNFVILKFYDKIYLLSCAENTVSVIDKIDDLEKISNIEQIIPRDDSINLSKSVFSKLLKKISKNWKTINNDLDIK